MVNFRAEAINQLYNLLDHDMTPLRAKDYAPGNWLVSKLCPGKDVPWEDEKKGITSKAFIAETKILMAIICSRISPTRNIWNVPILRDDMIASILDDIKINIGQIFINEPREYLAHEIQSLMFPSLINELCKFAGVKED